MQIYNIENAFYNLQPNFLSKFTIFQLKFIKTKRETVNSTNQHRLNSIDCKKIIRDF